MTPRFVLDAWALLALLQKEEPAASRVKELVREAYAENVELAVSIINLGEVVYRVGKVRGEEEAWQTLELIHQLPLDVISADQEIVWSAVTWKMHHAISYADAFALATTNYLSATLLTGDPELTGLKEQVRIESLSRAEEG